MFKEKLSKGLICLLAIGMLASPSAMGKKLTEGEQKATQVAKTKEREPKLVMEYKFDEPIIDVIFDEATMTVKETRALGVKGLEQRKASEKLRVKYPKVVIKDKMFKKSIMFLDDKGKVKKRIDLKHTLGHAVFSSNGNFIGVNDIFANKSESIQEISVINDEGNVLWKHKQKYPAYYEIERRIVDISNKGEMVVCSFEILEFFNEKGELNKRVSFSDIIGDYPKCDGIFSEDGEYFIAATLDDVSKGVARLILYNKNGEKLWEKRTEALEDHWSKVEISKNGDFIITLKIIKGKSFINVFNKEGGLVWEYETPWDADVFTLSNDEQYLLVGGYENRLVLFRLKDGKILWSFSDTSNENIHFHTGPIAISPNNKYVLVTGFTAITKPYQSPILKQIYLFT